MSYRLFHLYIVPDAHPDGEGFWTERVVPEVFPEDSTASAHMLREVPTFATVPLPGYHIVRIRESTPGPSDQPGSMLDELVAAHKAHPSKEPPFSMLASAGIFPRP